jgi:hypothetical protein
MKKTQVSNEFSCDFCNKSFMREKSFMIHMCETKRRVHDKDKQPNRIGYQCWLEFYKRNTNSRKPKPYLEFAKSSYYTAFVKFGSYCSEINVININRYMVWLLDNQIRIDTWTSDQVYTKYLIQYLREEDPLDAIARSIETTMKLTEPENIQASDCLRYINSNRICHMISAGKISPWMLYQSVSGIEFLEGLNEPQQLLIFDYINPEQWAVKFKRNPDNVQQVKELLKEGGY